MPRKKISTAVPNASAVIDLDDDDQLVEEVTTIKKVGRQRRPPEPVKADDDEPIAAVPVLEDDDEFDDRDAEDEDEGFPEGSVGFLAFKGEHDDRPAECTILVTRKPDGAGDSFRRAAKSRFSESPIRNVDLATPASEIEEIVRLTYGGGHYYLQAHFGNRPGSGWSVSLADPPESARETPQTAAAPAAVAAPAMPPVDPQAAFINSLKQAAELRGLLFGDVESALREEIRMLREERQNQPPAAPKSEKLELLELAFSSPKADVATRVVDALFPSEDESAKSRHWSADLLEVAIENKEALMPLAGSLMSMLFGGGQQPQPMMQPPVMQPPMMPPQMAPSPPAISMLQRKKDPEPDVGSPHGSEGHDPDEALDADVSSPHVSEGHDPDDSTEEADGKAA